MIELRTPRRQRLSGLAFSADGSWLAVAGDRGLTLFDLPRGAVRPLDPTGDPDVPCLGVTFAPGGGLLAWLLPAEVMVADVAAGGRPRRLSASGWDLYTPWQLCFSPDGAELWAARTRLYRWDTRTWKRLPSLPSCRTLGDGLMVAPDGRTAAVAEAARTPAEMGILTIRFHDLLTGGDLAAVQMPSPALTGSDTAAFSPDGRVYATFYLSKLWAWEVDTGRLLFEKRWGGAYFRAVAFSPDGRSLLAVQTSAVRTYRTSDWREVACLDGELGQLSCLGVAADGLLAAAGSETGRIVVWGLGPEKDGMNASGANAGSWSST